jgi:hypothetical protein
MADAPAAAPAGAGADADALYKYKSIAHKLRNVLESTQAELRDKTAQLAALKDAGGGGLLDALAAGGAGVAVAARVPAAGRTWVLLTRASDSAAEWRDEAAAVAAFPHLQREIGSAAPHAPPGDRAALADAAAAAQDQLRVFRVRAEALLRQRDAELATLRQRVQQDAASRLAGDGAGGDGDGDDAGAGAAPTQAQIDRLLRIQLDLREREARAREMAAALSEELAAARAQLAAAPPADGAGPAAAAGAGGAGAPSPAGAAGVGASASSGDASAATARQQLEEEYAAYRRRAVGIIKARDDAVAKLADEVAALRAKLRAAPPTPAPAPPPATDGSADSGAGAAAASSSSAGFASPRGPGAAGGSPPARAAAASGTPLDAKWAYLRRLLVKYLSTTDSGLRAPLEHALITVAELPPADVLAIRRAQEAASASAAPVAALASVTDAAAGVIGGLLSATGLWGGGGAGAAGGGAAGGASPGGGGPARALGFTAGPR